jgi:hypothetical protein
MLFRKKITLQEVVMAKKSRSLPFLITIKIKTINDIGRKFTVKSTKVGTTTYVLPGESGSKLCLCILLATTTVIRRAISGRVLPTFSVWHTVQIELLC